MDIAIHLGAHCTDEDRLLRTLLRNRDALRAAGVTIPAPGRVRPAIRQALRARSADLASGFGADILGQIADDETAARMVLSYEGFLGTYAQVLDGQRIYGDAGRRAQGLRDLFAGHGVRFYIALRNPATFVPALFDASSADSFHDFIDGQDIDALSWQPPLADILEACPGIPLTVWCNEDLPLIWPRILRALSGLDGPLDGDDAVLRDVMTPAGLDQLDAWLAEGPAPDPAAWQSIATDLLADHADPDKVEPEIDLPGWTDAVIARLSAAYARDVDSIRALPGLDFLYPTDA